MLPVLVASTWGGIVRRYDLPRIATDAIILATVHSEAGPSISRVTKWLLMQMPLFLAIEVEVTPSDSMRHACLFPLSIFHKSLGRLFFRAGIACFRTNGSSFKRQGL